MTNLTLRQLRYFEAVARRGHFGQAAGDCAVSQPALSMQIRDLEQALGAALFERLPRQVLLTGFGATVAPRVAEILRLTGEIEDLARAARDALAGRLRLGVIPTVAPYLLPRIMGALAARYPGLDLALRETVTPRLVAELLDGRLDAAILALPAGAAGLVGVPLLSESFLLVRPMAEAGLPVPAPAALRGQRLLLLEEGHCLRDQTLAFCDLPAGSRRDRLDAASLATLVQMVAAGLGVTLIPEMAVAVEVRAAAVAVARFAEPAPRRSIGMVWRASSPLARQLGELAGVVRGLASGPPPVPDLSATTCPE